MGTKKGNGEIDYGKWHTYKNGKEPSFNGNSIRDDREYGSSIFRVRDAEGNIGYSYTVANIGSQHEVIPSLPPALYRIVADIHTHGAKSEDYYDNEFSGIRDKKYNPIKDSNLRQKVKEYDIGLANSSQIISYLATPNGSLQKYDPKTGQIKRISNDMPSDSKDMNRLNNKSSYIERDSFSSQEILKVFLKINSYKPL